MSTYFKGTVERASQREKRRRGKERVKARCYISDLGVILMLCFNLGSLDCETCIRKCGEGEMNGGNFCAKLHYLESVWYDRNEENENIQQNHDTTFAIEL